MRYAKSYIFSALTLILMAIIFTFSAQPAEESSAMSSPIAEAAVDLLYQDFEEMEPAEQTELLDQWTYIIRKSAHFSEYALLGLLCLFALGSIRSERMGEPLHTALGNIKWPLIAFLISSAYAATDELHQYFVPGRSGQLSDVLLDSTGVAASVLLICLIAKLKSARPKKGRRK